MFFLESHSVNPAFNLALEQYVFDHLSADKEFFMLWQNDNAIIIGKHQNTIQEIDTEYVKTHGIQVVRRLSGGGAVYHDLGNINFTYIVNAENAEGLNLHSFCIPVVKTLAKLGIHAEISGRNDITIDGKKFSGNSQYLKKGRIMHHGTILFDSNLSVVSSALKVPKDKIESKGIKSVQSRITNLKSYLPPDTTLEHFLKVLKNSMVTEKQMEPYYLNKQDILAIKELQKNRYDTWEWNYGRSPKYSITKERRIENCGKIEINMEVQKGIISAFSTFGDYFGSGDMEDVSHQLVGLRATEEELSKALNNFPIGNYYNNLTIQQFIQLILQ